MEEAPLPLGIFCLGLGFLALARVFTMIESLVCGRETKRSHVLPFRMFVPLETSICVEGLARFCARFGWGFVGRGRVGNFLHWAHGSGCGHGFCSRGGVPNQGPSQLQLVLIIHPITPLCLSVAMTTCAHHPFNHTFVVPLDSSRLRGKI